MSDEPRDGGAAFPAILDEIRCSACHSLIESTTGMTLRDWFAGQAISPTLVQAYGNTPGYLAVHAYEIADAMLAERAKPKNTCNESKHDA